MEKELVLENLTLQDFCELQGHYNTWEIFFFHEGFITMYKCLKCKKTQTFTCEFPKESEEN